MEEETGHIISTSEERAKTREAREKQRKHPEEVAPHKSSPDPKPHSRRRFLRLLGGAAAGGLGLGSLLGTRDSGPKQDATSAFPSPEQESEPNPELLKDATDFQLLLKQDTNVSTNTGFWEQFDTMLHTQLPDEEALPNHFKTEPLHKPDHYSFWFEEQSDQNADIQAAVTTLPGGQGYPDTIDLRFRVNGNGEFVARDLSQPDIPTEQLEVLTKDTIVNPEYELETVPNTSGDGAYVARMLPQYQGQPLIEVRTSPNGDVHITRNHNQQTIQQKL
ncbi:MAG: hypothetical protein ACREHC_01100, partial [Candidatus Levyibacteriota bacterium]